MNNKNNVVKNSVFGGIALAAAAAGAYYLYGTDKGKQKRKELKSWMLHMKADVLERIETMKEVDQDMYNKVVGEVVKKYRSLKKVDPAELVALTGYLKGEWNTIKKSAMKMKDAVTDMKAKGSHTKKARKSSKK